MNDWTPASELQGGPIILGLHLRPITIGHLELLDELGINVGGDWSPADMLLICFALTQSASESRRDVGKWWLKPLFLWLGWRCRKVKISEDSERLRDWMAEQLSGPRVIRDLSKRGGQCVAPIHINLMAGALSRLHLSLDEARTIPIKHVRQLIMAAAESVGEVELVSERFDSFISQCNAADERAKTETRN